MSEQHQFDIKVTAPTIRKVEIEASIEVLVILFRATRKGRRTKSDLSYLEAFGDALDLATGGLLDPEKKTEGGGSSGVG